MHDLCQKPVLDEAERRGLCIVIEDLARSGATPREIERHVALLAGRPPARRRAFLGVSPHLAYRMLRCPLRRVLLGA